MWLKTGLNKVNIMYNLEVHEILGHLVWLKRHQLKQLSVGRSPVFPNKKGPFLKDDSLCSELYPPLCISECTSVALNKNSKVCGVLSVLLEIYLRRFQHLKSKAELYFTGVDRASTLQQTGLNLSPLNLQPDTLTFPATDLSNSWPRVLPVEKVSVHHHLSNRLLHSLPKLLHAVLQTRVRWVKAGFLQGLQGTVDTMNGRIGQVLVWRGRRVVSYSPR